MKSHGYSRGIFAGCIAVIASAAMMCASLEAAPAYAAVHSPVKKSSSATRKPVSQAKTKSSPVSRAPQKKSATKSSPAKTPAVKSSTRSTLLKKSAATKESPVKPAGKFARDLSYGMQHNAEVGALQVFLRDRGLFSGPATGNYFRLTAAAVQAFQRTQSLPASGAWRSETRAKANILVDRDGGHGGVASAAPVARPIAIPSLVAADPPALPAPATHSSDADTPASPHAPAPSASVLGAGGGGGGGGSEGGGGGAAASAAAIVASGAMAAAPPSPSAPPPFVSSPSPIISPIIPPMSPPQSLPPPPPPLPVFKIFNANATPDITEAKVAWETTLPSDAKLFLTGDGRTRIFPSLAGFSTRHIVQIGDLSPEIAYSFAIESIADKTRTEKTTGVFTTLAAPPVQETVQRILPRIPDPQETPHQQCFDALNPAGGTLMIAPISFQSSAAAGAYIERIGFTLSGSAQFGSDFTRVRVRDGAGAEHLAVAQGIGFSAVLPAVKNGATVEIMADTALSSEGRTLTAIIQKPDDIVFRRSQYSRTTFSYGPTALTAFPIMGLRHLMVRDIMAPAQEYFQRYCP